MKRIVCCLLLLLVLTACEDGRHFFVRDDILDYEPEVQQVRHPVFLGSETMRLAMHEPPKGTLIGMYTDNLDQSDRMIRQIESTVGVSHAAFMDVMRLGDPFPLLWILECIAEQKIPITVILPPENGAPFGSYLTEELIEAAIFFGAFNLPMFIVFYPVEDNWNPSDYIAFFRQARAIFANHAPQAAFVWSVDVDIENFLSFYPGELAVDWVGFSLFCQESESLERSVTFYNKFQNIAPIMLNLGVPHFTTDGHRYHINEAADALHQIYNTILNEFPRVRMVNYMNLSRISETGQDYSISGDAALREAYRKSVEGFLTEMPRSTDDIETMQALRSAYYAYVEEGRIYLDLRIVTEELGMPITSEMRWIGGARRIDVDSLGIKAELRDGQVWVE